MINDMSSSTVAAALINASPTTKVVHSMMSRNIQLTYILTSDVCYSGGASRHHLSTTLYSMSPPTDMAPPTVHVVQHGATYRSCRTAWRHLPFMSYNMVPPTVHVVQHGSGVARIFRLHGAWGGGAGHFLVGPPWSATGTFSGSPARLPWKT